ncbi:C-X-C motif chemokine 13-like [Bufo gargarizans]|uniref:C-X-C motif chemokine 13-like n=1 Tax=Bufo gargarizans TaxID=30331 RepID=UPI001CF2312E|nr:C-X-C motif chemokine 13-like [Bufo gargarizans]
MRSNFVLLWVLISLHCFFTTYGIWESRFVRRRCKCLKTTNNAIPREHFQHVKVLHETQNCRKKEIIIFLKNSNIVCVNPKAEWVKVEILNEKVK